MPKMKTNSAAKKRLTVTGGGKIKRAQQGKRHLANGKAAKTKRNLRGTTYVSKTQEKTMKTLVQG